MKVITFDVSRQGFEEREKRKKRLEKIFGIDTISFITNEWPTHEC